MKEHILYHYIELLRFIDTDIKPNTLHNMSAIRNDADNITKIIQFHIKYDKNGKRLLNPQYLRKFLYFCSL